MQTERRIDPRNITTDGPATIKAGLGPVTVYAIVPAESECAKMIGQHSFGTLQTISDDGFAAVVSTSPAVAYSQGEVARQFAAYQGAIDRLRRSVALLPVKFGTSLPDEKSVRVSLLRGHRAFADAFGRLKNCVQYEITAKWDLERVYSDIAAEPAVARLKERQVMAVRDDVWRAALGRLVKESLDRRRSMLAEAVSSTLKVAAADTIRRTTETDAVVLQMALLVRKAEIPVLEDCLTALQGVYGDVLAFACVGPTQPYSFATVEISVVEAEALERARLLFGLGPLVTIEDIRAAYQRLSRLSRLPVHNGTEETVDGGRMMALLTDAYRLLLQQIGRDASDIETSQDVTVSVGRTDAVEQAIYLPAAALPRC